ncbi:Hypothetical protein DHA2_152077 [Giardia duodenalis]|uniref:Uncharacterized protein n=1 Tax=Giardia intestinalis TaxID=5741 RepID=V6TFX3_GIAIN|nr:Hypothetical protein DHA2_152077 [Giardia intestinalis]
MRRKRFQSRPARCSRSCCTLVDEHGSCPVRYWAGRISLSSPGTLCLSSFASLRCSVSCLAPSHGRPQSQHVCPAERVNVFGVVSQVETHDLLSGDPKV